MVFHGTNSNSFTMIQNTKHQFNLTMPILNIKKNLLKEESALLIIQMLATAIQRWFMIIVPKILKSQFHCMEASHREFGCQISIEKSKFSENLVER